MWNLLKVQIQIGGFMGQAVCALLSGNGLFVFGKIKQKLPSGLQQKWMWFGTGKNPINVGADLPEKYLMKTKLSVCNFV